MYRVFNNKEKCWVREGIYLSPNNDLSTSKKALFGTEKLSLASDNRYTWHRDIGLYDKNNKLVFEGDICKCKDGVFIGVVSYVREHAAYYLLDDEHMTYYPLGAEYMDMVEVIGNVLENQDLLSTAKVEGDQNANT